MESIKERRCILRTKSNEENTADAGFCGRSWLAPRRWLMAGEIASLLLSRTTVPALFYLFHTEAG